METHFYFVHTYNLYEISLVLPFKQGAVILQLSAVCKCPHLSPLFGGKSAEGSKVVVTLLLPQMAESSDTLSARQVKTSYNSCQINEEIIVLRVQ